MGTASKGNQRKAARGDTNNTSSSSSSTTTYTHRSSNVQRCEPLGSVTCGIGGWGARACGRCTNRIHNVLETDHRLPQNTLTAVSAAAAPSNCLQSTAETVSQLQQQHLETVTSLQCQITLLSALNYPAPCLEPSALEQIPQHTSSQKVH